MRAKVVERAWVRVAREAVGLQGQVVPKQWFAHTNAPDVPSDDRRRLDLVVYVPPPTDVHFAAMRPWCHPLHGRVTRSPALPSRLMGRC